MTGNKKEVLQAMMPSTKWTVLLFALSSIRCAAGSTDPLDAWELRKPQPQVLATKAIAYGNGHYVAVGDSGIVTRSDGAVDWISLGNQTTNGLTWVTFDRELFVASEWDNFKNQSGILTSRDGLNWARQKFADKTDFVWWVGGVNDRFIAVGDSGVIRTGTDGTNWTKASSLTSKSLYGVAFGNGVYVTVGSAGTIRTSVDATNWMSQTSPTKSALPGVAFGAGTFVGLTQTNAVIRSFDGTTWTQQAIAETNVFDHIQYADGRFVAVGKGGVIGVSIDGTTWQKVDSGIGDDLFNLTYGDSRFVTISSAGDVLTSPTGADWTRHSPGDIRSLDSVAYGGEKFVAVGDAISAYYDLPTKNPVIQISRDGDVWTTIDPGTTNMALYGVGYLNGNFIAVGGTGLILTSADGNVWWQRNVGSFKTNANEYPFGSVTFGNGLYLAAASQFSDGYLTSPDAISWTKRALPAGAKFNKVRFLNDKFVGVGFTRSDVYIGTSPDGFMWTKQKPAFVGSTPNDVAYGAGLYVVVGQSGGSSGIQVSSDAVTWTLVKNSLFSQISGDFRSVVYAAGMFVAVGGDSRPFSSRDGLNWSVHSIPGYWNLREVAYGDGSFIAVGQRGGILRSGIVMTLSVDSGGADALDKVTITGREGAPIVLQGSTDLHVWSDLSKIGKAPERSQIAVTNHSVVPNRFYRAVIP